MQKKSNKNTNPESITRPLASKQPDSFIKNSYKNTISDVKSQKSSNYDRQPYEYHRTPYFPNHLSAHDEPYEAIKADPKSHLRPVPNSEYESYAPHQNSMQVESLGYRDVQNVADKALSPEELRRQHQAISRPQKEDHKEAVPARGKGVSREVQAARDRLSTFKLEELKVTKKGGFDDRYKVTKEYLSQCAVAEVDPLDYYRENCGEPKPSTESSQEVVPVKEDGVSKELQAARDILSTINLADLKITKKGVFDNRYNNTKEYLAQCATAEVDPLDYYEQNFGELKPNTSFTTEAKSGSRVRLSGSDRSNDDISESKIVSKKEVAPDGHYYNMDGSLDMRYKNSQIALKIAEAKEKLSKIDTSKLKRRKDGELDGRYKENKEYLELEKQCHEEYYNI